MNAELVACTDDLELYGSLERRIDDADTLYELGREEGDDSFEAEVVESLDVPAATASPGSSCGPCSPVSTTS